MLCFIGAWGLGFYWDLGFGNWSFPVMTADMNRWLARLAMSFFIIAAVLTWYAYQALQHGAPLWRPAMNLFAAAAAVAMWVIGTREKHRRS